MSLLIDLPVEVLHFIVFYFGLSALDVLHVGLACRALHNTLLNDETTRIAHLSLSPLRYLIVRAMDDVHGRALVAKVKREGGDALDVFKTVLWKNGARAGGETALAGLVPLIHFGEEGEGARVGEFVTWLGERGLRFKGRKSAIVAAARALRARAEAAGEGSEEDREWLAVLCGDAGAWRARVVDVGDQSGDWRWMSKRFAAGESRLALACMMGHVDVVRSLLADADVDPNATFDRESPLVAASGRGHAEIARLLLAVPGIDPDAAGPFGGPPLLSACENGHVQVVRLLLAVPGLDPNAGRGGVSPLLSACRSGDSAIVRLLLAAPGIEVNIAKYKGETPLHLACQGGHVETVRLLLADRGVDLNVVNSRGQLPVDVASARGHLEIVTLLSVGSEL